MVEIVFLVVLTNKILAKLTNASETPNSSIFTFIIVLLIAWTVTYFTAVDLSRFLDTIIKCIQKDLCVHAYLSRKKNVKLNFKLWFLNVKMGMWWCHSWSRPWTLSWNHVWTVHTFYCKHIWLKRSTHETLTAVNSYLLSRSNVNRKLQTSPIKRQIIYIWEEYSMNINHKASWSVCRNVKLKVFNNQINYLTLR